MSIERRALTVGFAMIIAALLQMLCSDSMRIGPARPDFIIATLAASSVTLSLSGGAAAGIWAGLLMTAIMNVNYGSFLVSRSLAGTFCGWAVQWVPLQAWPFGVPAMSFMATIGAETIYYLMAPTHRALWWLEHMTLEALYDAVISLPIAALLILSGLRRPRGRAFD